MILRKVFIKDYKKIRKLFKRNNLDIIKNVDWVIDLGPDGGYKGGNIMFSGNFTIICIRNSCSNKDD